MAHPCHVYSVEDLDEHTNAPRSRTNQVTLHNSIVDEETRAKISFLGTLTINQSRLMLPWDLGYIFTGKILGHFVNIG